MSSLKFNQLLVLSNSTKSGNVFNFSNRLNLITATDNSVGKSTLIKLLSWGIGCEPFLDTTWKSFDSKVIVKFTVKNIQYQVMRYNNIIHLKEGDNRFVRYTKITGTYSEKFAQIVDFKALLFKRNSTLLETPPPAYFFLPFYIDQKKSWVNFWDHFDNLQQYDNFKTDILNYHIGLYTTEYFELLRDINTEKIIKSNIQAEIDKMNTTLEVVNSYIPGTIATIKESELQKITDSIRIELNELSTRQEELFHKLVKYESEKAYYEHQKDIAESIINELEDDYQFAVENLPTDEIECPLCGTIHENSVFNRASILTDKLQAESQLQTISDTLSRLYNGLSNAKNELNKVKEKINAINEKYTIEEESGSVELVDIIDSFASNSIQKKVIENRNINVVAHSESEKKIKKLNAQKKEIISPEHKDLIDTSFFDYLSRYVQLLEAEGINLSEIKSPRHFNKLFNEGGAADGIRAALAFYISIYSMSAQFCDQVISSLLIDTPNQQEQSEKNYDKVIEFLLKEIPEDRQIILAAMDNPQLKSFKDNARVILLDDKKLLSEEKYLEVKNEFDLIETILN